MAGLVPVISLRKALCPPKQDRRDIGVRKRAVLRTAMPGDDGLVRRHRSNYSLTPTRRTKSEMDLSVASGASRCGEWRAPGNNATSTGQ
jgi:hypothetical protein